MTVPSATNRSGPYNGNGSTTVFSYGFRILDATHLRVIRTSALGVETVLANVTDYTVANVGSAAGGQITLAVAPATGEMITILRDVPFVQETDLENQGAYYAQTVEDALDLAAMRDQQLSEELDRSLRVPVGVSGASLALPAPEAGKIISWDGAGTGLQNLSPNDLATIAAYGTANSDIFTGDGVTTMFGLSANPAALNNLDVAIGGVTQLPGVDYTWTSGTNITFTAPPANGAKVLVRYMQVLAQGSTNDELVASDDGSGGSLWSSVKGFISYLRSTAGSSLVGFLQSGTGASARSAQDKLREWVSVKDFGAVGNSIADDTAAFNLAIAYALANDKAIWLPAGTYRITSRLVATLPNPAIGAQATGKTMNLRMYGEGFDRSRVSCTACGFLRIVGSSQQHSFALTDFAVMADQAGGGYVGVEVDGSAYAFFGEFTAKSTVRLHFRGNDGINRLNFWSTAFGATDWSNIDFSQSMFDGTYNVTVASGWGVVLNTVASQFACQFYFTNTAFRFLTKGLVVGDGIQSVKMDSPFFGMNSCDIHVPSGQSDHQDFQIVNPVTFGHAPGDRFVFDSPFPNLVVMGGAVGVSDGYTGFKLNSTAMTSIIGTHFFPDTVANSAVSAIDIAGTVAGSHCIIDQCNFAGVTVGARLLATSANVRFGGGNKWTVGMSGVTNAGTNNAIGELVASPIGAIGYITGAGGSVTQSTSKVTAVTINTPCGQITTNNAALAAGAEVGFTVNCAVASESDVVLAQVSNGNYGVRVTDASPGSFVIRIKNLTGGSLSDAVVINFALTKATSA